MNKELTEDFITLIDDDGNEMEFEILDQLENEKGNFYALLPNFELSDVEDDGDTYFIFKSTQSDSGDEEQLEEVEDEKILDELSVVFEKHFDKKFKANN